MDNMVFKQSVMGFNRTQVLEYIDTLVKQLKDREDEYAQKQQEYQQDGHQHINQIMQIHDKTFFPVTFLRFVLRQFIRSQVSSLLSHID